MNFGITESDVNFYDIFVFSWVIGRSPTSLEGIEPPQAVLKTAILPLYYKLPPPTAAYPKAGYY